MCWATGRGTERVYRASLFVTGRTESHVEEAVQPLYAAWRQETPPIETTILATPGQIELHLSLRSGDRAAGEARLREAQAAVGAALGSDVFGTDGRSMEEIVGSLLARARLDDRRGRIVHGRSAPVAPHRRTGELRLCRRRRGALQQ